MTKELLIHEKDVQAIHGFVSMGQATAYLDTDMLKEDVFVGLRPTWAADPETRFYKAA